MEYNILVNKEEYELINLLRQVDEESRIINWQEGIELLCQGKPVIVKHRDRFNGSWSGYEYRTDSNGDFVLFNNVTKCFDYKQHLDADDILMGKWYKKFKD